MVEALIDALARDPWTTSGVETPDDDESVAVPAADHDDPAFAEQTAHQFQEDRR
jgi:hypothetical protein